jgi:hypothetical protein
MRRKSVLLQELARGARPAHCSQHRQVTRVVDCPRNLIQPRPVVLGKRTGNDAPIPSPKFPVREAPLASVARGFLSPSIRNKTLNGAVAEC